jgi:hypothetical protein
VFHCHIDHVVVTAPTLERGADFVIRSLGVEPQVGGEHPRMGTHNLLLRLGDSLYLEVIAANPNAPKPQRPRWFSLDEQKPESEPRLAAWVARTDNIQAACDGISEPLGEVEVMTRGSLQWRITVPADGSRPLVGIAPALIEWQTSAHPALNMKDAGCSLFQLEAFHADAMRVSILLGSLGLQHTVRVSPLSSSEDPYLVAHISTPNGMRTIGAPDQRLERTRGSSSLSQGGSR